VPASVALDIVLIFRPLSAVRHPVSRPSGDLRAFAVTL